LGEKPPSAETSEAGEGTALTVLHCLLAFTRLATKLLADFSPPGRGETVSFRRT
jgi:hypothetical protein